MFGTLLDIESVIVMVDIEPVILMVEVIYVCKIQCNIVLSMAHGTGVLPPSASETDLQKMVHSTPARDCVGKFGNFLHPGRVRKGH